MTLEDVLDGIGEREGLVYEEPPKIDQPTGPYGVTLPVLMADRGGLATLADLKALTPDEARTILQRTLERELATRRFNAITYEPLRIQLLDYAWNSGEARAIRWLQRTVLLPAALVTGVIDDRTLVALARLPAVLINNALAAERAHAAYHGGAAPPFAAGVARRAIDFTVPLDGPLPEGSVLTT